VRSLALLDVHLPEHVIQRRIQGYHLHARGGAVDIPTPRDTTVYATFRGPGPLGVYPEANQGFDWWLLSEAAKAGATHLSKLVVDVRRPEGGGDPFLITCRDGSTHEADVLVGAFGVNSNLVPVFEKLGFGYRAPRTVRARQGEIPLDPEFIGGVLRNRVVILAMGRRGLRFVAVTPKRQHVTVTLIGDDPSPEMMKEVLNSAELRSHFPPGWEPPERYCTCAPKMPVSGARNPVADRLVVIGDANIGRYLKNGIESSFYTAMWAAKAIVTGTAAEHLGRRYLAQCNAAYRTDNLFGRALFRVHDLVSRSALITRAHLALAAQEQRSRAGQGTMSNVLWGLFTGNAPYRAILRQALGLRLQARLAMALARATVPALLAPARASAAGSLGPLGRGKRVIVVGAGPAGASCAALLAREGRARGSPPHVVLIEAKRFGEHQNRCAGVLSPPGGELLEEALGNAPPDELCQRHVAGYILHGAERELRLDGAALGECPVALRRVELDALLLKQAEQEGVQVIHARATDLEVGQDGVVVYTDGESYHGDMVVGAFALDEAMARALSRQTGYRAPAALETLTCKIHPAGLDFIPKLLGDCIHVFLPRQRMVEFGALIPKGNHITVVIAGARLTVGDMERFLAEPNVAKLVPRRGRLGGYYKGAFPLGAARGLCADRYVVIGDAAGLVRPFKGKGINCALESGMRCARTILDDGVSRSALASIAQSQRTLTRDLWYGRLVRLLVWFAERFDSVDPVIDAASSSPDLRQALFDCISGRTTYRDVVLRGSNLRWLPSAGFRCLARVLRLARDGGRHCRREVGP
jgi:flavin-dependent dehydrogenase